MFGELVPKNLAIIDAEQTLGWLVVPMRVFVTIFRPVIRALDLLASAGLRIMRVERRQELVTAHTAEELGHVFTESHRGGLLGDVEHRRLADSDWVRGAPGTRGDGAARSDRGHRSLGAVARG